MHLVKLSTNLTVKISALYRRTVYIAFGLLIAITSTTPAYASQSYTSTSIPSTYTNPSELIQVSGYLWYRYSNANLARVSPSGETTTYDLRALTSKPTLTITKLTHDLDGNIWFSGFAGSPTAGKLDVATGIATTYFVRSGTVYPDALAAGSDGNIYIIQRGQSNNSNNLMRITPSTGVVTELVSSRGEPNTYWKGLSATSDGRLVITKVTYPSDSYSVQFYNIANNSLTGLHQLWSLPITLNYSLDRFVLGPDGNIWFSGYATLNSVTTYKIVKMTTGGNFTQYTLPADIQATNLTVSNDGALWFANNGDTKGIGRITTSGIVNTYPAPAGTSRINTPTLGSDGAIWYLSQNGSVNNLGRFEATPDFTSTSIPSIQTSPSELIQASGSTWYRYSNANLARILPSGETITYDLRILTNKPTLGISKLTYDLNGNIWFTGLANSPVAGKLDVTTGTATTYPIRPGISYPGGLVTGSDGNIYLIQQGNNSNYLMRIIPNSGVVTELVQSSGEPSVHWEGLSATSDGRLVITRVVYPGDSYSMQFYDISDNSFAGLHQLWSLPITLNYTTDRFVLGPDSNIWFSGYTTVDDVTIHKIIKLSPGENFTQYTLPAGVQATALTVGSDGALWFTNNGNEKGIGRITVSGTINTYPAPTGTSKVSSPILGNDGAIWYLGQNGSVNDLGRFGY